MAKAKSLDLEIVPATGEAIQASVSKIIAAGDQIKGMLKSALDSIK